MNAYTRLLVALLKVAVPLHAGRRIAGQEDVAPEPLSRPSAVGAAIIIAVGAAGSLVALLAPTIGERGGRLAVLGSMLPCTLIVFCIGLCLAVTAR